MSEPALDAPGYPDTLAQPVFHTTCRVCHGPLAMILTLGEQYCSDFPASAGSKPYPPVPLDLMRCTREGCGLVQLAHTTPREWMYTHYWYRSGVNETMRAELRDVIRGGLGFLPDLDRHLTVGDIGANDGTLLSLYPEVLRELTGKVPGLARVAWEPAKNLYQHCRPHAEVLFPDFFGAGHLDPPQIRLLTMIACFYDIEDPHALVGDVAHILHKEGVWVIQQAYLPDMLAATGYDNIGHEHLEYYHLAPLERLLADHGLEVFHVERRGINGGSFRTYVGWAGRHAVQPSVAEMRGFEVGLFADPGAVWAAFAGLVALRVGQLMEVVEARAAAGPVDIYGASTKGNTLLQTCGLDARLIRQAWERSEEKYGRYVGVSGIPIVPEAEGRSDPPRTLLVLPWGFRDAFLAREHDYLVRGGALLFPLPDVQLVEANAVSGVL